MIVLMNSEPLCTCFRYCIFSYNSISRKLPRLLSQFAFFCRYLLPRGAIFSYASAQSDHERTGHRLRVADYLIKSQTAIAYSYGQLPRLFSQQRDHPSMLQTETSSVPLFRAMAFLACRYQDITDKYGASQEIQETKVDLLKLTAEELTYFGINPQLLQAPSVNNDEISLQVL